MSDETINHVQNYSSGAEQLLKDCLYVDALPEGIDEELESLEGEELELLHRVLIKKLIDTQRDVGFPGHESSVAIRYGSAQAHMSYFPAGSGFVMAGKLGGTKEVVFDSEGFHLLIDFLPLATAKRVEGMESITTLLLLNDTVELYKAVNEELIQHSPHPEKFGYAVNVTNSDMARFAIKRMGFNKITTFNYGDGREYPIDTDLEAVGISCMELGEKIPEIQKLLDRTLETIKSRTNLQSIDDARREAVKYILHNLENE